MDSRHRNNNGTITSNNEPRSEEQPVSDKNFILKCIVSHFDSEMHAKFQQVLEYLGEKLYTPLYDHYNSNLLVQFKALSNLQPLFPDGYSPSQHVALKIKFYTFRFISNIAKFVVAKLKEGDIKAEQHVIALTKLLLYHGLVAKSDTANFALVELEQLCVDMKISLNTLYIKYRTKFLRVIIKAILTKLMSNNESEQMNGNGYAFGSRSSWPVKSNCVITYMTRAFEVFNIGTITSDDVAQSLIITTNLIHKEKYNDAIQLFLNYLAKHQNIDVFTLVRSHIQAIIVSLLLKRKLSHYDLSAALNKLGSFCEKTPQELLAMKFTSIKGRLLLYYSIDAKIVTDAIYYLSKFEKEEHEQPFEDELDEERNLVEYLNPSMIGILLGVDSHFTATKKDLGSDQSIKQIESLCKLISILNETEIEAIHVKLLSTLSLLLRLRPKRDDMRLNKALRDLWALFLMKLSRDLKVSLMINICVALYDLVEDCPEDIADIYTDLVCNENTPVEKLRYLFFIPDIAPMNKVYAYITPHVRRDNSVPNLRELQTTLDCILPLLRFENQKCHLIAIAKLAQLLKSNQQMLISNMLINSDEPLDHIISRIIESLLSLSSAQDPDFLALIAECLGILGAVNPIRLDHLIYGGTFSRKSVSVTNLASPIFIVDLIEKLKSSLFSDQRSESETANYALQVVVDSYNVLKDPKIKLKLSEEAQRACNLCKNTSYSGSKRAKPDLSLPVYEQFKSENQYSYKEWVDKFSVNLISTIRDKKVQDVLHACSYIFRYNLKLAEYLLPHAIVHIIINQPSQVVLIKKEVMSIVDEDVGVSTQDLDTVYTEDKRSNIRTLHFQCANLIFCVLDAVNRLDCETKTQLHGILSQRQVDSLKEFITSVPKDKLAMLAAKCRSHARALCYFEQYLFSNKNKLDEYSTALQRIYVALDDTFEAAGVEMVKSSPMTVDDYIANYEACGKFDKAFVCCTTSLDAQNDEADHENLIENSLRCLSNQGDYHRLYEKSKQLLNEYSQFRRTVFPYAIEATWKLGKWDELDHDFKNETQIEGLLESASIGQGYLLAQAIGSKRTMVDRLKTVRHKLIKPLSIAMMDRSAYFRGYQNLLVLHSLEDFALALNVKGGGDFETQQVDENTVESMRGNLSQKLDDLNEIWFKRNKLVEPSLRSLEPILVWQRTVSLFLAKKYPFLQDRINIDVARKWLTSAGHARESRSFDRSFFCLTQAQRWFGSAFDKLNLDLKMKFHLEQAKLDWDQGEQTRAIRGLKLTLNRLKHHPLSEHLDVRRTRNHTVDPFPQLNSLRACADCGKIDQVDRKAFHELKMLLAHYCEEGAAGLPETLFYMYEECVHLGVNQEETYFRLARYYDRLLTYYMENPKLCYEHIEERSLMDASGTQRFSQNLMSGDKEEVYTKLMQHSIIAFGNSLKFGVRYLRESLPRLLNIWYDLGAKRLKSSEAPTSAVSSRSIGSRIESTVRFVDELKRNLPPYYFMTAISILLSRIAHPHSGLSKVTCGILESLLINYPHQLMWHMIAVLNDTSNEERKKNAKIIVVKSCNSKPKGKEIEKVYRDTLDFVKLLNDLCINHGVMDPKPKKKLKAGMVSIREIVPNVVKYDFNRLKVMAPVEASIRAIIPIDNGCDNLSEHVVFPEHNVSYVVGIEDQVRIFNSLQQPRQVNLKCHNGRTVQIICKSGDDLRKDSRCIEFLNLLNNILRRNSQSNARFFDITTFLVLPISSTCGIIEMVPNLSTLRYILDSLYKERNSAFSVHDQFPKRTKDYNPNELHNLFKTVVLPKTTPPVFPTWFLRKFTEPTSWYMAKLAYTRSMAVISMGGYIIGLGDRHLDNILIDTCNGRIVHVDFNLLFHQAETLPTPERVPFRLTQNLVAALGPMGTEGNFRKVCEITMRVMRKEKDALLTTLKPFIHDPCSEWIKNRDVKERGNRSDQEDKHAENKSAKYRIEVTERKLKGFPRSRKFKPLALIDSYSVEAQVDNLIEEACDTLNLAQMYYGWCPHI